MKLRTLIAVCLGLGCLALLYLTGVWFLENPDDGTSVEMNLADDGLNKGVTAEGKPDLVTDEDMLPSQVPGSLDPMGKGPVFSVRDPMSALPGQLEPVVRKGSKHSHLLRIKYSDPEILFVANHLLALPESEAAGAVFIEWAEQQTDLILERVTARAYLLTWTDFSAEAFVDMRDRVVEAFGDSVIIEADGIMTAMVEPNDPDYRIQGHLHEIEASAGWEFRTTAEDVIVAVLDSGVDIDHGDLSGSIYLNQDEIPGNGIDDDANEFIDDVHGWDFYENDAETDDPHTHGTHISGIIGATGNNATGIAGVAWSTRILPVRFLDEEGYGSTADLLKALDYIRESGAHIVNASFGHYSYSKLEYSAFRELSDSGIWIVCSAGNNGSSNDSVSHFPSDYNLPGILSIGAAASDGGKTYFSNFGKGTVDLFAPGSQLLSALPDNNYGRRSGTSQAAAVVSGALALLKAETPSLGTVAMREYLQEHSLFLDKLEPYSVSGSVLNLRVLLDPQALAPPLIARQPIPVTLNVGEDLSLSVEAVSSARARYQWFKDETAIAGAEDSVYRVYSVEPGSAGLYKVVVENNYGSVASDSVRVDVLVRDVQILNVTEAASILGGAPMQLKVRASGSPPLAYQWYKDAQPITGANSPVFSLYSPTGSDAGTYFVEVSNPWSSLRSPDIPVTAYERPDLQWKDIGLDFSNPIHAIGEGFYFEDRGSTYYSDDGLAWVNMNIPQAESINRGPYYLNGRFYFTNTQNKLRVSDDFTSWETLLTLPVSWSEMREMLELENGFLISSETQFHFINPTTLQITSYQPPVSGVWPTAFNGGADLRDDTGRTFHSPDGISWTDLGTGLPRRIAIDEKTGLYLGYDVDYYTEQYMISVDGVTWEFLPEAYHRSAVYITGYLQKSGQRYDLETRSWADFPYYIQFTNGHYSVLAQYPDLLFIQPDPDEAPLQVNQVDYSDFAGDFHVFHGELYALGRHSLYYWPAYGLPFEVELMPGYYSQLTYMGKVGENPVFQVSSNDGAKYFRFEESGEFVELFPPGFIAGNPYMEKNGDVWSAWIAFEDVWSSRDMENWIHEVGFPGSEVYQYGDHLIGWAYDESTQKYSLYKKNFALWQWEKIPNGIGIDENTSLQIMVASEGFVALSNDKLFTSRDGVNWTQTNEGVDNLYQRNGQLYVRIGSFYYLSQDGGTSWVSVPEIPEIEARTEILVARSIGSKTRIARLDGFAYRPAAKVIFDTDPRGYGAPTTRELTLVPADPADVSRVDVEVNGLYFSTLPLGEFHFLLDVIEPGIDRVQFIVYYEDGWTSRSPEIPVVTGIPLEPVSSGWIGSTGPSRPGPGVSILSTEEALYVIDRFTGSAYRSPDGVTWELIIESIPAPDPRFIEPKEGFLAISYRRGNGPAIGLIKSSVTGDWLELENPNNAEFITNSLFGWRGRLFAIFADGKLYEISESGEISFVRRFEIPAEVYFEGSYPFNAILEITVDGSLCSFRINDHYFLSDDLEALNHFSVPDGWTVKSGLTLVTPDFRRIARIVDALGNIGNIKELLDRSFESLREPYPGWFIGEAEGLTWIGNEAGQFFPLSDPDTPSSFVWRKGNKLVLLDGQGQYQTLSAYEFEAKKLTINNSKGVVEGRLQFSNYGILTTSSSELVNCGLTVHSASTPGLQWDIGQLSVDLSRSIPTQDSTIEIKFPMPEGMLLGDYFLQLEIDADNEFPETDENNNSVFSNVFVYDPNVTLISTATTGGEVLLDGWTSSKAIGSDISLNALADSGYAFLEWSGAIRATTPDVVVNMDSDKRIQAHFVPAWLKEHFPGLRWRGIPGWYHAPGSLSVSPVREYVAYADDFGWLINDGFPSRVVWHPALGWLWHYPEYSVYYVFESGDWVSTR